jgi:hypothetical protein
MEREGSTWTIGAAVGFIDDATSGMQKARASQSCLPSECLNPFIEDWQHRVASQQDLVAESAAEPVLRLSTIRGLWHWRPAMRDRSAQAGRLFLTVSSIDTRALSTHPTHTVASVVLPLQLPRTAVLCT